MQRLRSPLKVERTINMDEKQARRNRIINITIIVLLIGFITFRVATACNALN